MTELALTTGKTYYTPNGVKYELSHLYDGSAFCHPIQVMQSTNYHGDDFEEHEFTADHLVELDPYTLTENLPVEAMSDEIAKLRDQSKSIQQDITKLKKDRRDAEHNLATANREVEVWKEGHPLFQEIHDLMNGVVFAGLVSGGKHDCINVPKRLKDTDALEILTLKRTKDGWEWITKNGRRIYGSDQYSAAQLFRTEEELQGEVLDRWTKLLDQFKKKPDYGDDYTYNSKPNYGTLVAWKKAWPHIRIPSTIEDGRATYLEECHRKEINVAAERLAKLRSAS